MIVPAALQRLTDDAWLLFATRFIRLFAYGSLSVVLVFYLVDLGLSASQTGLLLTLTLVGDTLVSLYLTTRADRIGRRRMLILGAALIDLPMYEWLLHADLVVADLSTSKRQRSLRAWHTWSGTRPAPGDGKCARGGVSWAVSRKPTRGCYRQVHWQVKTL